jgi:pimeloyl-ACP methyl ester carboxylesterase
MNDMERACIFAKSIVVVSILTILLQTVSQGAEKSIEGIWMGVLKVSVAELRIVFKISKDKDGSLSAKMDSPDQGAENIPVSKVTFENGNLHLESEVIRGAYDGTLQSDDSIEGTWKQSGLSFPLVLKRTEEAPKLHRPQEPTKPYPYVEEEVGYENTEAGIRLAGTLTFPKAGGPFPAVILISGSGAQDRNETVVGHRPFLVLADFLTRKGIAVLRLDDRGVGGSTGNTLEATSEDFAGDVLVGVKFLKTRKEIDPNKIGLIGHSEGGIIAPIAAVKSPDVAFIVLLAGTGLTGEEILYLQSDLILKSIGASEKVQAMERSSSEQIFDVIKHEQDRAVAETKIRKIMTDSLGKLSDQEKEALGASEAAIEVQLKMILSPWFRFFLEYDPKPTLMKVKCPVLAMCGQLDLQVPPKENLSAMEEALKAGGNSNCTIKEFPGLNHLFQKSQTGAISEYAKIEETMAPAALETISQWILLQTEKMK